jgi:integrase
MASPRLRLAFITEEKMSVRRMKRRDPETGQTREFYMVDVDYQFPDGRRTRVRKVSPVQSRRGAEQYERDLRQAIFEGKFGQEEEEVPHFTDWFRGRYWREWVIGRMNKPGEAAEKMRVFETRLEPAFGKKRIDQIGPAEIGSFRASLVEEQLSQKTINNTLAVLSKPLRYAEEVGLIRRAPKVGLFKVERPEFVCWELDEYVRILEAAKQEGMDWYVAVCLAGEAGFRVGEVRALRWREDVDMVAGTITVNRQTRNGVTGTPKGRTRRTLPMSSTLIAALRGLETLRTGFVVRNEDGTAKTDGQTSKAIYRIYDRAGLGDRDGGWHVLRHSFGTHAALFGVNPWTLMRWMGHKRIDETMLYVNLATAHMRQIDPAVVTAGARETDPDRRVVVMLGARGNLTATAGAASVLPEGGQLLR